MRRSLLFRRPMLGLLLLLLLTAPLSASPADAQQDSRFFAQTGYRVGDDAFWEYFRRRGAVRTFGYPVSNVFVLGGLKTQIFQREIVQERPDGSVGMMNLLDEGVMPYTRINGSHFPASDAGLIERQPKVGRANYHAKALEFVKEVAPDIWEGRPVNFYTTFSSSVTLADAYPDGKGDPDLLPGFNLEIWGLPTSRPTPDPANAQFVYLRFQRGIMHFDAATGQTNGLLLGDYVRSILTLRNLPPDLAEDAKDSPLFGQLDPNAPSWLRRRSQLPGSDLTDAFRLDPVEALGRPPTEPVVRPSTEPVVRPSNGAVAGAPSVLIDPGHGGREIGASFQFSDGTMLVEKDLNLKVATKVVQQLRERGVNAMLSRGTDVQLHNARDVNGDGRVTVADDLQARVDMANGMRADLLVSVHFNGVYDPTKRGTQVFYADGRPFSDRSRVLAETAQANLVRYLKDADYETISRGATPDSRLLGDGSHFYLLGPGSRIVKRPSEMPGIIGEPLFVTNPEDANALRQERIQDAVARAYADAVRAYFERYPKT